MFGIKMSSRNFRKYSRVQKNVEKKLGIIGKCGGKHREKIYEICDRKQGPYPAK